MKRRQFLKICTTLATLSGLEAIRAREGFAVQETLAQAYPRARLVRSDGTALKSATLKPHTTYLFFYPYSTTPCFLLDLGETLKPQQVASPETGETYRWPGGAGPRRSIVAYSAICSHAFVHPDPETAMISYLREPSPLAERAETITCCVHGSVFDPKKGAAVLKPPAPFPLAAIQLEWDAKSDQLAAVGVRGKPVFHEFFKSFPKNEETHASEQTNVVELQHYTKLIITC
ncbi:MAG: Rieske 2Fe-2S domain-containing protein [Nitrospirae bacterium]|nr:Rieske 2Fe-2S domain-containing protein [Nitrospirota bacterium]